MNYGKLMITIVNYGNQAWLAGKLPIYMIFPAFCTSYGFSSKPRLIGRGNTPRIQFCISKHSTHVTVAKAGQAL